MNDFKNRLHEQLYIELSHRVDLAGFNIVFEATWHEIEHDAVRRAKQALLGGLTLLQERYTFDPMFRNAVDSLAQIMVAGVFGRAPVSKTEYEERARKIQYLLTNFPTGPREEPQHHG